MVGRIGFYQTHSNIRTAIHDQKSETITYNNQLNSQKRVQKLRQDPVSAALGSRYESQLTRTKVFITHNRRVYDDLQLSEGTMQQMVTLLQRVRELAVQGANGTFDDFDTHNMAVEVNEIIEALYQAANQQDSDGNYMFGGTKTSRPPFYALRTNITDKGRALISSVEYLGSDTAVQVRISDNNTISNGVAGSRLMWTGNPRIYSNQDVGNFILQEDSVMYANGEEIALSQGDTINSIIEKINNSDAMIRASRAPITGELVIEGSNNEQLWLKDVAGTFLQDIGITTDNSPPNNVAPSASSYEETVFASIIELRDALFNGNHELVGGKILGAIDRALESTLENLAKVGAVSERLDIVFEKMDRNDTINISAQINEELAIDFSDIIVRLKELQQVQQATFAVSNQIMNTSLLNYLR